MCELDKENTSPDLAFPPSTPQAAPVSQKIKTVKKPHTNWSSSDDALLIEMLTQEKMKGHQSESDFEAVAYNVCATALTDSHEISRGSSKNVMACKNRFANVLFIS